MQKNDGDEDENSYTVTFGEAERVLLLRGLEQLQLTLLHEAGGLAYTKIKRRKGTGSMENVVSAGMERLGQLKLLKQLSGQLADLRPPPDGVPEKPKRR